MRALIPCVKWAGGKRWLVVREPALFPEKVSGRYIEPFLGGAAVFLTKQYLPALLADSNEELINAYRAIRDDWRRVEKGLRWHHARHSKDHYYKVRDSRPRDKFRKAIRFLYLNRTCWNGLYRVNRLGRFNVPIGTKTSVILDSDNFPEIARLFRRATFRVADFRRTIAKAKDQDFVFIDPPYTVKHNINGFRKYNERIFSWDDQIALRDACKVAADRGAKLLITQANHDSIKNLYAGLGKELPIERSSVLASLSEKRVNVKELVIKINY